MPFREIVGHRRILRPLSHAAAGGTLAPSLLFAGPAGVGKRTVALALAQVLNCVNNHPPPKASSAEQNKDIAWDACGECSACRRIARAVYPDVVTVTPSESGDIKIEQVREIISQSVCRPFEGRRRVTIIDNADALLPPAQNALLKTLEEPPSASLFVLVTSRPDVLLPTVTSRCARIRFGRLSPSDVAAVLVRDHKHNRRDAIATAALSDGSVSGALNRDAEEFSDARQSAEALLRSVGTRRDVRVRMEGVKYLLKGGGTPAAEREYLELRLQALSSLVRDLGILTSGARADQLANSDRLEDLGSLAREFDSRRVLRAFDAVDQALMALDRNMSPKVIADWLAVQL
jgi:DNA polymerase III subunit delta'